MISIKPRHKYIHAIRGGVIAAVIFTIFIFLVPEVEIQGSLLEAFGGITFVYAILAGFYMGKLNDRYITVGKLTSDQDSWWTNIYRTAKIYNTTIQKDISDFIERYYLIVYDNQLGTYYKETAPILDELHEYIANLNRAELDTLEINTIDNMLDCLSELEVARNDLSTEEKESMTKGMWVSMISLGGLVILGIYLLRDGSLILDVAAVIMSTGIVITTLLVRDLNNFKLGGTLLAEESGQEVFDTIGRLRYYHISHLKTGLVSVPSHIKEYRVGVHKIGATPQIEVRKNLNYKAA